MTGGRRAPRSALCLHRPGQSPGLETVAIARTAQAEGNGSAGLDVVIAVALAVLADAAHTGNAGTTAQRGLGRRSGTQLGALRGSHDSPPARSRASSAASAATLSRQGWQAEMSRGGPELLSAIRVPSSVSVGPSCQRHQPPGTPASAAPAGDCVESMTRTIGTMCAAPRVDCAGLRAAPSACSRLRLQVQSGPRPTE